MERIKKGFTNESFCTGKTFYQIKKLNKFNHKIDYQLLEEFDFVPKLLSNTEKDIEWVWVEYEEIKFTPEQLKEIANNFLQLHNSDLKFPKSNHAQRVKEYRSILKNKNINIKVLNKYYRRINNILSNSENNRPLHNDLYSGNLLLDKKTKKIMFIDWEYASMGDKHFDLAYFICGSFLTKEQERIFLDAYDSYWEEYLIQQKILVYYLTILWIHAQDVMPFSDEYSIQKLEETIKEYDYLKQNNLFRR
ncbi:phosphotransferase family protein [Mycoplasmopsis canis]|uniref:phosphotransferase family protein n=1 Tax=Mycoplasmopsis canis TaxID=29555 RepID=UPI00025AF9E8|nr:phosphotransferase [Mycoplasmopsis canis]EIE40288.1 PTS system, lichenan-specific IIA component LicA [Mycoplasmopsis canis UF33]